jgi:hypothetical protein
VFKKTLKVAIGFVVLLTAHVGYVRLFAIVAEHAARGRRNAVQLQPTDSRTKKEAIALAARGFGAGHWSADRDLPGRYYNKERGYWMYYKEYERRNEGKQFLFKPFALIWQSRDKKELKTITADEAVMDLDQPLGLTPNKPGTPPMRMTHAQITGNVRIRDDRGTADTGDDLLIGPMPYIEYDEASLQLRSESDVVLQDREMRVTGYDLLIQLRPKSEVDPAATGGGFEGAKTAFLKKNPHVILYDSGNSGVLPGKAPVPQQGGNGERTPIDLRCAGQMQIDLPKPRLPVRVGPPAPPDPTIATFTRDVVVLQAKPKQVPDQLNCDYLKLTFMPGQKPPPATATVTATADGTAQAPADAAAATAATGSGTAPADPAAGGGALGGLTLHRADATGHAVWLQSVSQGIKTLSNELIYKKLAPEKPDETYLRGDNPKGILVEKLDLVKEGPNKGKIEQITTVRSSDATIFDDGQSRDPETIIARGPGILEVRPARDKPVARRAVWRDQLVMQNEIAADKQLRKRITLTGDPKFFDLAQATTLDAKNEIIVWLKPKTEPATPAVATTVPAPAATTVASSSQAEAKAQPGGGKFDIEVLRALGEVHLLAPGRTLTARDVLVALFENLPEPAPATTSTAATTTAGASAPANATMTASAPASATTGPPAAGSAGPVPIAQGEANVERKPTDPDVRVRANHVWARIALRPKGEPGRAPATAEPSTADGNPAGKAQSELREARLRGAVSFHEDPAPGKQRGTNVTGEAIDVTNRGENKMYFKVYNVDPDKAAPLDERSRLSPNELLARIETLGRSYPLARVETEDFTVDGPKIGLDQLTDEAWVDGRGVLEQLAPVGLLSDKGLDNAPAQSAQPPAQTARRSTQTTQRSTQAAQPPIQTAQRPTQTAQPPTQIAQPPTQTNAPTKMTPLRISWTRSMQFKGQSTNPQGVPAARAHFVANVRADMEDSLMLCQEMTTYMDRPVKLMRPKGPKPAAPANGAQTAPPEPEPKPQIALIDCLYKVQVDNRKHDPETRTLVQRQVIFGEHVIYEKLTGNFFAQPGPGELGRVYLYSRDGEDPVGNPTPAPLPGSSPTADQRTIRPTANPTAQPVPIRRGMEVVGRNTSSLSTPGAGTTAASPKDKAQAKNGPPAKPVFGPLKVTQIVYADEMHGRFGTGKERDTTETRWADFFGDVEVLHAAATSATDFFDFDNPPADATFLTAQTVRVVTEPPSPGSNAGARSLLRAWENANAETIDMTIQADKITYDSSKELFYAYGELDQVYLVQQKFVGQPPVTTSGRAVKYNRKTGESELIDPKNVQFVDDKFGVRPGRALETEAPKKGKKPLVPFRGPGRAHFERKGFNGH